MNVYIYIYGDVELVPAVTNLRRWGVTKQCCFRALWPKSLDLGSLTSMLFGSWVCVWLIRMVRKAPKRSAPRPPTPTQESLKGPESLVWSGLLWSGLVCSGLVWSGLVWSGLLWSGLVCSGLVWSALAWSGLVWSGLLWSGLVCSGVVWSALVWSGLVCSALLWSGLHLAQSGILAQSWLSHGLGDRSSCWRLLLRQQSH